MWLLRLGHVVNLVCKALLHRTDAELFEKGFAWPDPGRQGEVFEKL